MSRKIDTVGLLYRKACSDENEWSDYGMLGINVNPLNNFHFTFLEEHKHRAITLPRRFDVTEVAPWTIGAYATWFNKRESMVRAVENTRWEDKELEPITYDWINW